MKPIIEVANLSKRYTLGNQRQDFSTLSELILSKLRSPHNFFKRRKDEERQDFWALKDINLEVFPGEVIGIIGRNGAGKSTLLKILSRITKPTAGKIKLYGRIESLLEVGTGFHPELTGRENIFLNGAILGMKREEISRKFDEIVAFAEVEKFLDTEVKHYSSGMYVRLAFAIAAHLEPEILIIDEVLAVGDAEFQKKCLGKMDEVSKNGRTVIFVSHQMGTIAQLCPKAVLLEKGRLVMQDSSAKVIEHYTNQTRSGITSYTNDETEKQGEMFVQNLMVLNNDEVEQSSFRHDSEIKIRIRCRARKMMRNAELRMVVRDKRDITVFTADAELNSLNEKTEIFEVDFTIPSETLRPNNYSLTIALFIPHQLIIELIEEAAYFSVYDSGTKYAQSEGMDYGLVFSPCQTSIKKIA